MGQDLPEEYRPAPEFRPAIKAMCERLLPIVREAAKPCGYAIALHGSMERDLDLVAAPWVEDAADYDGLIGAIRKALSAELGAGKVYFRPDPQVGPHGRRWANFYFSGAVAVDTNAGAFPFIDLSIMPRIAA